MFMASRNLHHPIKLLRSLPYHSRRLKRTAPPPPLPAPKITLIAKPDPKPIAAPTEPPVNLDDSKELFSSFSTTKLIKSAVTLQMASMESVVELGSTVINSRLMKSPISKKVVLESIEHTFYDHFCGGKNLGEADRTVKRLWDSGLRAMLDYGLEHAIDNGACDRNADEFVQTIESTKFLGACPVSFVVVKITAICPPNLLSRLSDLLRWAHRDKSLHLPWKLETLPIFAESSPTYHTLNKPDPLTPDEERDLELAYSRLTKICKHSSGAKVPLLIDAEDTSIQPAIDYFTYSSAIKYRSDESPLIFNTIQAYLKDAKDRLVIAKKAADEMGVPVGFKLVRGAYMTSERRIATCLGVKSPIHDTIQDTHACYNDCAAFMLEEIARGSGSVVLATHNLESGKLAAAKAVDLGIKKESNNLQFAQLYGMAEALSFGLRNAGFKVSKYLPFGPVEQVIPYLLRRAEENKGLLSTSSFDRQLMRKEILRRLKS
ncbi:proline dehydrogenase 2 mitochondrial [Phtheirospermum japonicum]|uniref:Proline dehydrogenase n=1 Tax=Phtheirospermum japonicum TaxID=374723 RepID=A0A830D9X5_9LAMI|nr:proline dehydrogenase 2 mitochondrial [Phtheirospermum japonicum]